VVDGLRNELGVMKTNLPSPESWEPKPNAGRVWIKDDVLGAGIIEAKTVSPRRLMRGLPVPPGRRTISRPVISDELGTGRSEPERTVVPPELTGRTRVILAG
jgi:hypothetical protein